MRQSEAKGVAVVWRTARCSMVQFKVFARLFGLLQGSVQGRFSVQTQLNLNMLQLLQRSIHNVVLLLSVDHLDCLDIVWQSQ